MKEVSAEDFWKEMSGNVNSYLRNTKWNDAVGYWSDFRVSNDVHGEVVGCFCSNGVGGNRYFLKNNNNIHDSQQSERNTGV